jgi:hypothetical protein
MMVREKPEICPEEKTCDSPEGEWITSLMYPLEFVEEMASAAHVMRGRFYQGYWEALASTLVPPTMSVEVVYNDIFTDVGWDALIPTLVPVTAAVEDVRVYAELEEAMTTTATMFLTPGVSARPPLDELESSAIIVGGGLS